MIFGHTVPVSAMGEKQRLGKIIKLGKGDRRHIGKAYVIMVIEIPILFATLNGVCGLVKDTTPKNGFAPS